MEKITNSYSKTSEVRAIGKLTVHTIDYKHQKPQTCVRENKHHVNFQTYKQIHAIIGDA